jgi:hypothetical protein
MLSSTRLNQTSKRFMGVVYKLKQDVIDYVLHQKMENPSIGCRQLAEEASRHFSTKISKSSISIVLKDFHLSNSVGRPVGFIKHPDGQITGKVFQIPAEKKKELFDRTQKMQGLIPQHHEDQNVDETMKQKINEKSETFLDKISWEKQPLGEKEVAPELSQLIADIIEVKKDTDSAAVHQKIENAPEEIVSQDLHDNEKVFWDEVKRIRQQEENLRGNLRQGTGVVLLKIAANRFLPLGFWSELFRRFYPEVLSEKFDAICEAIAFLELARENGITNIESDDQHALWTLTGLTGFDEVRHVWEWMKIHPLDERFVWAFFQEMRQNFYPAAAIRVVSEDKKNLFLKTNLKELLEHGTRTDEETAIFIVMTNLMNKVICNQEACIIHNPIFNEQLDWFLLALQGQSQSRLAAAAIIGCKEDSLAEFVSIPSKKRNFVLVQEEGEIGESIAKLVEDITKRSIYIKDIDEVFYVSELNLDLKDLGINSLYKNQLRVIAYISAENKDERVRFLLTNQFEAKPEAILLDLFLNNDGAPNVRQLNQVLDEEERLLSEDSGGLGTFNRVFQVYGRILAQLAIEEFPKNDINNLVSDIYDTDGYIYNDQTNIKFCVQGNLFFKSLISNPLVMKGLNNKKIILRLI